MSRTLRLSAAALAVALLGNVGTPSQARRPARSSRDAESEKSAYDLREKPEAHAAAHVLPARHREAPDDPPAPASVLAQRATEPARAWSRASFTSVQVNVDPFQNNIIGDAANEPSIAIDPTDPDRIVIGWRQFDTIASNFRQAGYAYSHDAGQTWAFPGVIEPGVFRSDPVLDTSAGGNFYYYSLTLVDGDYVCDLFKSTDGGATWDEGVYAFGGDKEWMVIDKTDGIGRGNIYAVWSYFYSCCTHFFTRSTDGGSSFMTPIHVPSYPVWGTMAIGPEGELYVGGISEYWSNDFVVVKSTNAQNPSVTPTFTAVHTSLGGDVRIGAGPNPSGLLGQVGVAADQSDGPTSGNVYLLASVDPLGSDPLDVMFSRSTDGGSTWSAPIRVNDDLPGTDAWQWFGTMSVAPNGRIDVIWNDTRSSGVDNLSELYYSFSTDAGTTWSANTPVSPMFDSHVGWPNQQKLGDYYDMISDNGGASLAYAATFNGEQDVYFLRIPVECTGGGVVERPTAREDWNSTTTNLIGSSTCTPGQCPNTSTCIDDICYFNYNRYLYFHPHNVCQSVGLRVRHVASGETRWMDSDYKEVVHNNNHPARLAYAFTLPETADPAYAVWPKGPMAVTGCFIVPGEEYEIQAILEGDDPANEANYTPALTLPTAGFGDAVSTLTPPGPDAFAYPPQGPLVDVTDMTAVVEGFTNMNWTSKMYCDLVGLPDDPSNNNVVVDVSDMTAVVDAYGGAAYPGMPPQDCP